MFKIMALLTLMLLMLSSGCNNPSGGSVISSGHTPLLQPPSAFNFSQIRAKNGNVSIRWQPSLRASEYKFSMGTAANNITTPLTACSGKLNYCELSGLDFSTTYYFSVEASNASGKKTISSVGTALSVGSFEASALGVGDKFVDLNWTAAAGATGYHILYGTTSGLYSNTVTNVTSPYRLSGLSNGLNYYVRVVAINAFNGYSLSDSEINGKPFGPPNAPLGLSLTSSPGSMNLSWNPVQGATSYNVYRGSSSGALVQLASALTSNNYSDSSIVNGSTYYFAIEAYNGYTSPQSAEVAGQAIANFDIAGIDPGSAPNQMIVSWPAVAGATNYQIRYGTTPSNLNLTANNAASPHTVPALMGGTTYYFRVVALNNVGGGASLNSLNQLSGTPIPAIAAPTGLLASASSSRVTLNWNHVTGATSYEVLRGTTAGTHTSLQTGISSNSLVDSTAVNGVTYYYVVRSFNGLYSAKSTEVATKPIAEFGITAINPVSSSSLEVNWNLALGADAYDIRYGTVSGSYPNTLSNVTAPFTISGLTASTTYYVVVRGRNATGSGTSFQTAQVSALTRTTAPNGLIASTAPGQVNLDWNNTPGATSYSVYRGTSSGSRNLLVSGLTSSDYQDTTVINGTSYYYVVTASNGSESAYSIEVVTRPLSNFSLSQVIPLSPTTLEVSWPAVTGATSYDIRYGTSSGSYTTTLTNRISPATISGLSGGTTYFVIVVARNNVGSGSSVTSNELFQGTPVGPPTGIVATAGAGQITLNWSAMNGASSYKIYRGTTSGVHSLLASEVTATTFLDNSGVVNGTVYYYVLKSFNGVDSADSAEVSGKAIAPFSISALQPLSPTAIQVSWPNTAGGDSYDVRYGTTSSSYTTTLTSVISPVTVSGLTANTNYFFIIRARNSVGTGTSLATSEQSARTPVAAPTGITASALPGQVNLSWSAVTGASSYKIYRGTVSGIHAEIATGVGNSSYVDNTINNGTTYYYVVRAFNGVDSAASNEAQIRAIANFSPSGATALNGSSVEMSWPLVDGATDYDIRYGTATGSYTSTISGVASPAVISGLNPATRYYFVVRARNAVGTGTAVNSSEVNAMTATAGPTGLVATASPSQVGLNWNTVTGASSYRIYRGLVSGSQSLISSGVTSTAFLDTTVTNGVTYYYTVRAFNGTDSAASAEVSVRPIASFNLTAAQVTSSTSVNLTWNSAVGADTYDLRYGTSPGVYLWSVSNVESPHALNGLSANTTYYFSIRARNAIGAGTYQDSNAMSATTATAAPGSLSAQAVSGEITLSWSAVSGAASYKIFRGTTSGTYSQIAAGVTTTSFSDTTVSNGSTYFYVVRAFNGSDSANSIEASALPIAAFSISSTQALSPTSLQVSWNATAGASTYDVRYGTSSGNYVTLSGLSSPYNITGLSSGTLYYIVVRARNTVGTGASASTPEVTQITPISAPGGLVASAASGQVVLTWNNVTGADSYKVWRGTSSENYTELAIGLETNSYTDGTAVNGTTYFYVVSAYNGADSTFSNQASIRPIAPFSITSATVQTATSISLEWPVVAGAETYDIKYGTTSGNYTTTLSSQLSPATISSLASGSTYYFVVVARNAVGAGTSRSSPELGATTAFGAPSGLVATAAPGQASLSWNAVSGATNYKVLRGSVSGSYVEIASGVGSNSFIDTGLSNGTSYFYVVRAFNGTDSDNSNEAAVMPIANFSISSAAVNSASSITLSWSAPSGASAYDIRYGTSSGSYATTISGVVSAHTITGLSAGTNYFFSVRARNGIGAGTQLSSSEVSARTAPTAPLSLAANATSGQVALSWGTVASATSYRVYRGTLSGSHLLLASSVSGTSFADVTIENGTTYFYVVRAFNGAESANSNEAAAQAIAPFSISSTTAPGPTSITVSWPAAVGASAYDIHYGTSTGSYATSLSNVTSPYTITGLSANTTHYIIVRARNSVGAGSSANTPEVFQVTPLGPPSGLLASAAPGVVTLSWNSMPAAQSFKIYRGTSSGSHSLLASGVTSNAFSDSTVINGTTYFYVVTAFNGVDSAASNEAAIRPIANFAIASISSPSDSSISLSWPLPDGAATFEIRYGISSGNYSTTISGASSPHTISGLTADTNYYISIRASNTVGAGTSTNSSESLQRTAMGPPTGLIATATTGQVNLNWNSMTGATSYKVYRGTNSGSYTLLANDVLTTSYTDPTVVNGTTYYYVIRSFNGSDSGNSSEVSILPIAAITLNSAVAASATSINLSWSAAAGASVYDVRYGTSAGSYTSTITGVTSPYTLNGLTSATTYYLRIQARNNVGNGTTANSNELSATTATAGPSGLTASASPGSVGLNWNAVTGASSYKIFRGTSSGSYLEIAAGVSSTAYLDTTVINGTTYFYVVRAFNGADSANSNEISVRPIVSFLLTAATAASATAVNLTWDAATGADTYDVLYGTASGVYLGTITNVTSPYTLSGLSAATLYYVAIKARNSVGAGSNINSNERTVTTSTAGPSGLTALASLGQIALSWNSTAGAVSYRLYRGTATGVYSQLATGISGTNFTDNTIINGTSYFYVVRAFNGTESVNSNESVAASVATFAISSATGLSTSSIQVSWNSAAGASAYDVRWGTVSGSYTASATNVTSPYSITGLTGLTRYFIVVRGRNTVGLGSSTTTAEVSQMTATNPPTNLTATGGSGQVGLSWSAVTGAESYKILRGTLSGSYTQIASGITSLSYTDSSVANGTSYFYVVRAFNGADSSNSNEASARPIAPFAISSIAGSSSTSLRVEWGAATGAATYDLRYGTVAGSYTTTLTNVTSPHIISGLITGTTYFVQMVAKNSIGSGTSVNSLEASGTTNTPPVLSSIADQVMEADTSLVVNFNLSDNNDILTCSGAMSASSSNTTILPASGISFSGTLPNCSATITPQIGQAGQLSVTFTATDGKDPVSRSFNLTVTPCTVASIDWETQPMGMAAGNLFGTAPRVSLRRINGALCTTNFEPVTLYVSTDPTEQQDARITGMASVTPSGGYAHFTGARMERAGDFTVEATQNGVATAASSSSFSVTPLAASRIIFYQQPLTNDPNSIIIPHPSVRTVDIYGNYVGLSNVSITLSLQDNNEGASLSGTLTVPTNASGIAAFNNLALSALGSYFLRASPGNGWTIADSDFFDIIVITPQNTLAVLEMINGPINHASGKAIYDRSGTPMGTNFLDGNNNVYTWKLIGTNTGNQTTTVRLRNGATDVAFIEIPKNTPAPQLFSASIPITNVSPTGNWSIRIELGTAVIYSSRIIAKQLSAKRTQVYLPLLSVESNSTSGAITTASSSYTVPSAINFPTYEWDSAEFNNINGIELIVGAKTSAGSACAALYNRNTNTQIGGEVCTASTAEISLAINIPKSSMPPLAELQVRVRATAGGTASIYKAGLMLRLVNIVRMKTFQRIAPAFNALNTTTNFVELRSTSYVSDYGTAQVREYIQCRARAATAGSGSLSLFGHGTATSGSPTGSALANSALSFTNQTNFTTFESPAITTSNGNNLIERYTHSSGAFELSQCLLQTEADY